MNNNVTSEKNRNDEEYKKEFEIFFEANAHDSYTYPEKILNYSLIFSLIAFIEIIYTTRFLMLTNENSQICLNTDLYTIII